MRRVAAEFDTGPASLYAHVANKDALLRLVLERVIQEIEVPTRGTWQETMRAFAHSARAVYARHGDIARVSFAHIPSSEAMLTGVERMLAAMIGGGVPARVATWSLDIMAAYVAVDAYEGYLLAQRFPDRAQRPQGELEAEWIQGVRDEFAELSRERFPFLTSNLDLMMSGSGEERFAFGIDLLIGGIAAQCP